MVLVIFLQKYCNKHRFDVYFLVEFCYVDLASYMEEIFKIFACQKREAGNGAIKQQNQTNQTKKPLPDVRNYIPLNQYLSAFNWQCLLEEYHSSCNFCH